MGDDTTRHDALRPDAVAPPGDGVPGSTSKVPSIAQLVEAYHQAVYRYAYRLAGSVADAEDLTQQTFLIAQQKLDQIREPEKADRWLLAIARSRFLKNCRRHHPVPAANVDLDMDCVAVEPLPDDQIDGELLQLALADLPDQYRVILVMYYFEELSYRDIAGELEVPLGTVMSRLARAKSRLRTLLAARQSAAEDER
jgi:RNA polymerase sigma-70 factor (ECF subfamily)